MDVKIIYNIIHENILELIKKHPESLALKWFESKNLELQSHYELNLKENVKNKSQKNANILVDLNWDCDSNEFMIKIGNFLNNIVNQREKLKRSNLGQEFY